MADRQISIEEHVTCSICMDLYNEPLALPCMHSFCKRCLQGICASALKLNCPECRTEVKLGNKGLDGLSKNFQLGSIVESYKRDNVEVVQSNADATKQQPFCTQHRMTCQLMCKTCKLSVCVNCVTEKHSGHKLQLSDKQEDACSESDTLRCTQHSRQYKLFCRDCDALVCLQCITKQHLAHAFARIEDHYEYNAETVGGTLTELEYRRSLLKATQKTCRTLAQKTQVDAQRKRQELSAYFARMRDVLDKREAVLKSELEKRERQSVDLYMKTANDVQKKEQLINHVTDDVKRLLTADKVHFLKTYKARASRMSDLLTDETLDGPPLHKTVDDVSLITCPLAKEVSNIQWRWPKEVADRKPSRKAPPVPPVSSATKIKMPTKAKSQDSRQLLQINSPVQRGKDWNGGTADGGPGHFGTVCGTTLDPEVYMVQWPNGNRGSYKYAPPFEQEIAPP